MAREELPVSVRHALEELAGRAQEIELRRALNQLGEEFDRWKQGAIGTSELESRVHLFHQGPSREIHLRYRGAGDLRLLIASAIHSGILDQELVPAEVLPHLDTALEFYRELAKREVGSVPG